MNPVEFTYQDVVLNVINQLGRIAPNNPNVNFEMESIQFFLNDGSFEGQKQSFFAARHLFRKHLDKTQV